MDPETLEASLAPGGPHNTLGRMAGSWQGTARTLFMPGELADESTISGEIRTILGGRFVCQEYERTIQGEPLAGMAIHGYDLDAGEYITSWVDSFHNGTTIMLSRSPQDARNDGFSVLGGYGTGEEAKGVEIQYERAP